MYEGDMIRTRTERVRRRKRVWALQNATLIAGCFFFGYVLFLAIVSFSN